MTTGGTTTFVPVNITTTEKPDPVSFRRDVIAAMNVGGCNMGACHGTPSGKNGFKLSLRGFDPAADYLQLTRDVLGRRTSSEDADASLMLQKGLGRVPHEGGQRFHPQAETTRVIRTWLAEGLKDDAPTLGVLKSIDVFPGARIFRVGQHPAIGVARQCNTGIRLRQHTHTLAHMGVKAVRQAARVDK